MSPKAIDPYERIIAASGDHRAAGLYESNYLKANAPDGSGAFWMKHNVLIPVASTGAAPVAEFWCVAWHRTRGWVPRVWKQVVPLGEVELAADRILVAADAARLTTDRAEGRLSGRSGGGIPGEEDGVSWRLDIRDELPPVHHLPGAWQYEAGFPRKKSLTPSPRAVFDGILEVGDERIDVSDWVGHRGHNWGTEHAHEYAYGNCNLWDDGADLTVDGATARVLIGGGLRSPWITLLGGRDRGVPLGASSTFGVLKQSGDVDWPRWFAYGGGRRSRVRLEMELDPNHAVGLHYLHPDGKLSYCYNVKDARVDLLVSDERHTSRAGELEFLFPAPVPGIPMHGETSLADLTAAAIAPT